VPNRVRDCCLFNDVIKRHIHGEKRKTNGDCSACRIEYENNACLSKLSIGKSNGKKVKQLLI